MITPQTFFGALRTGDISPFVGVPCSLLSSLIAYAGDHPGDVTHVNPPHESQAMAYAAGTFMATGKLPMVYLQNSGLGNVMNPLTSLHQIYDIPALLLVTWRAERGWGDDAPEHWIMGRDMEKFLQMLGLPYRILSPESWEDDLDAMAAEARKISKPAALVVKKGLFEKYERKAHPGIPYDMADTQAIAILKEALPDAIFLSTTGMISRKSYAAKESPDFYMMGSMGAILGIAEGCAEYTEKRVVALDGDGAALMHLGQMALAGQRRPGNLVHVIIDNESYFSTGDQPTISRGIDFAGIAKACGYRQTMTVRTEGELRGSLSVCRDAEGPILLHVKTRSGAVDKSIKRISDDYTCQQVKDLFMDSLRR